MAIDLKELLIAAQNKIGNSTISTATRDLVFLAKTATRGDTSIVAFDSDGEFLDSASHVHRIAYHRGRQNLFLLDSDRTWKPISGTVAAEYSFQGSTSGYVSGGFAPGSTNTIQKYPYTSNGNATDVGDLTEAKVGTSGQSSSDNGYNSGGTPNINTIEKFPFSSDANSTDVGDLTVVKPYTAGQSSASNGYSSGANSPAANGGNTIDKFPFAADANATDVGDITVATGLSAGQSSETHGYTSGGAMIDKFPFASDGNATDVGDQSIYRTEVSGQSSETHGYMSGGWNYNGGSPLMYNVIDKFPFSSDTNATDVGDMTSVRRAAGGTSSTTSGYTAGGVIPTGSTPFLNIIDKFPFSSDGNATDVGDLLAPNYYIGSVGQQV